MPPNASNWFAEAAGAQAGKINLTLVQAESIDAPWRNALINLARAVSVVQDGSYDNILHPLELAETLRNDIHKLAELLKSAKYMTQAIQVGSADVKLKGGEQLIGMMSSDVEVSYVRQTLTSSIALEKEMTGAIAESRAMLEDLRATAAAQSTKQQSLCDAATRWRKESLSVSSLRNADSCLLSSLKAFS